MPIRVQAVNTNMKSSKKNFALMGAFVCAMLLAACGSNVTSSKQNSENNNNSETTSTTGGESQPAGQESAQTSSKSKAPVVSDRKYNVTINGEKKELAEGSSLTKPADPAAPAGKAFYGWKNTLNGGQIWNFERDDLNIVLADINLEPCFVDADLDVQILEAELCPNINAVYGGELGMPGATYSGGQQGKGLIGRDWDGATGATGIDEFNIAYVHFMYIKGDKLTWEVESDSAAENVALFASFSAEYGLLDPVNDDRYSAINDKSFPITVNGEAIEYGSIKFHNIPEIGQILSFQDYFISGSISLKAGKNIIEMTVDNMDTLNGTIASSAPCVDSIKVFSTSELTWNEAVYDNLERD